jgi:NaMN:DMB phosphoribosyltransferase
MCGVSLGAQRRIPVVIDGFVSIWRLFATLGFAGAASFQFSSHASMRKDIWPLPVN